MIEIFHTMSDDSQRRCEECKKNEKSIAKNTPIDNNTYKDFMSIEGIKASKKTAGSIESDSIEKLKNIF